MAHNHQVAGSNPAPATKKMSSSYDGDFFLVMRLVPTYGRRVAGENCQWQFARKPSDGNWFANREVSGSRNVTESCPRNQEKILSLVFRIFSLSRSQDPVLRLFATGKNSRRSAKRVKQKKHEVFSFANERRTRRLQATGISCPEIIM